MARNGWTIQIGSEQTEKTQKLVRYVILEFRAIEKDLIVLLDFALKRV